MKEYFERLPVWVEGEDPDYIQQLAEYVTASDPNWFRLRFKKALVRAAACALEVLDFNKQCLVLAGKQDDGKTSFLRYLCPLALRENYTEQVEFGNKDGQIALATNFIINIDELKGLERQEITRLKAFFTTASVKLRRPYDKKDSWAKRKASFFASTNDRTFLTDETGNVRWLIFDISSVKHDNGGPNGYQVIPIDRVWSQACALLKSGFEFRLTKPEIAMSEKINNANYSRTTVEIDLVQEYLQPADRREPGAEFMNTTNVMMYLQEKAPTMRNIHVLGVGKALTFLRFSEDSQRINGSPRKGYWVKKIENGNATLLPDYKEAEPLKEKDLVVVPF
ncbi:MAG: virulence-associated E family protein [Cytophagaceae bacterium]|nr:virulence-associated E family protein [Cytophagaceae bacterium]